MFDFKRAFFITLSSVFLVLLLVFAFELINRSTEKSGFSSGEVFDFSVAENVFSGEIFGRKFSADLSPAVEFFPKLRFLGFFLPPFIRLGFIIIWAVF